jgi:hypothetical protein
MNEQKIEHESFAVLGISRISGNSGALFGSSIEHQHFIEMIISPAYIRRDLNQDWIHSSSLPYIVVQMSNSQFAECITSMNMGSGTPVTLKRIHFENVHKIMQEPPSENKRLQIDTEFEKTMLDMSNKLDNQKEAINKLCETMPKKFQQEMNMRINSMYSEIKSTIPFIKKQFTEQMDKTVLESKGEIEGFFQTKIQNLGIQQLKLNNVIGGGMSKLIENVRDEKID